MNKLEVERENIENNKIYENAFEWRFEFPEVLNDAGDFIGFDVVIGNPPYVLSRESFTKSIKKYFFSSYRTIHEKPNLYLLFIEKSHKFLNKNGEFSFIIPNSLTGVESAKKVREMLLNEYQLRKIVNLIGETFENVGVESIILMSSNQVSDSNIKYQSINSGIIDENNFNEISPAVYKSNRNYLFDISSTAEEIPIIEKIKLKSDVLLKYFDVRVGLQAYERGKENQSRLPKM
ncbi:MAG: Eco57I restriction-modification methylase domain-containing protein [Bacteroidota bacterium]|nr:Eco57I restriction-modification methylase domain-containing protein [Bacteroidota bacterium]